MPQLSRPEKVAAAQLKLRKFRNSKMAVYDSTSESADPQTKTVSPECKTGLISDFIAPTSPQPPTAPTCPVSVCSQESVCPFPPLNPRNTLADYFGTSRSNGSVLHEPFPPFKESTGNNECESFEQQIIGHPVFIELPTMPIENHDSLGENDVPILNGNAHSASPIDASSFRPFKDSQKKLYKVEAVSGSDKSPTAATEKLLQLSQQLNGILHTTDQLATTYNTTAGPDSDLISSPYSANSKSADLSASDQSSPNSPAVTFSLNQAMHYIRELENRNVELASLLENRTRLYESSLAKISFLQEQNVKSAAQAAADRTDLEQSTNRDLSRAHEQVRVHAQTVGVLVAEKTELQAKIDHLERLMESRSKEIDAVNEKLQVYKLQSQESERAVVTLKSTLDRANASNAEIVSQIERLKSDIKRETCCRENLQVELDEAYSKLHTKIAESLRLESSLAELKQQLDLKQVYTIQLSTGVHESTSVSNELTSDASAAERISYINRIQELECAAQKHNKDKSRLEFHYKGILMQVEAQVNELRSQLSDANRTNSELTESLKKTARLLKDKEEELTILHTEHQLLRLPVSEPLFSVTTVEANEDHIARDARLSELTELNRQLQCELVNHKNETLSLQEKLATVCENLREKDALLADRKEVLQHVSSEKVTLSRVIEQNRVLKQQLAELQDSFVHTTNQNMQLTTELQQEKHSLEQIVTAQQQRQEQMDLLQEDYANLELAHTKLLQNYKSICEGSKQPLSGPIEYDGQHCKPFPNSDSHTVDNSIPLDQNGNAVVNDLKNELNECRMLIGNLTSKSELSDQLLHRVRLLYSWLTDQQLNSVERRTETVSTNPTEAFTMLENLLRSVVTERSHELARQAEQNRQHLATLQQLPSIDEWHMLQVAHTQLEAKFLDCMEKLSAVSEDRTRLETTVAQLEMEASTVGEYVTLFAHRRAAASRRAKAREQLLCRLVEDRKKLRQRLRSVQSIFPQSKEEEKSVPGNDLIEEHGQLTSNRLVYEFQTLLNEVCSTIDEKQVDDGFSVKNDEESQPDASLDEKNTRGPSEVPTLEKLRQQALQHDCPHCQCCVGNLIEI